MILSTMGAVTAVRVSKDIYHRIPVYSLDYLFDILAVSYKSVKIKMLVV